MTLPNHQRGTALIMALIMLVVLTMVAVSSVSSTNTSIRIVGNMQIQDEITAAAQVAIENKLGSVTSFTTATTSAHNIDINADGTTDYVVQVAAPVCKAEGTSGGYSASLAGTAPRMTYWDIAATVTDARTGARTTVHQGVKINLLPYMGC